MNFAPDILEKERTRAVNRLLSHLNDRGFWEGRLSSSALATAVACVALFQVNDEVYNEALQHAWQWLSTYQNNDGGWGDSPESKSNLSTTLLVWASFAPVKNKYVNVMDRAESWILERTGSLDPEPLARAVINIYGKDKTFSAPILALCALSGRLGPESHCWQHVAQLPMEAAALPHGFFRFLRLPVVSYAIPALIGIGLLRHMRGRRNGLTARLRDRLTPRLLNKLADMQPSNGGFLEATPLTAFVTLSMAGAGRSDHIVVEKAVHFLLQSQRDDGSWPIDTDLATWVTTLSIKALDGDNILTHGQKDQLRQWLLDQQYSEVHPFTAAAPGGWAWTHWPGAVPDADDTAGALLALKTLSVGDLRDLEAATHGIRWIINLQNSDGGIPTFCRGWGKLPFDRSCPDITAHALRALWFWKDTVSPVLAKKIKRSTNRMVRYLCRHQHPEGYWLPLWFGHQQHASEENPMYGTAMVMMGLNHPEAHHYPGIHKALMKAKRWLESQQKSDGGWSAGADDRSTVEETALVTAALSTLGQSSYVEKGAGWLIQANQNPVLTSSPIGLYFASLWYDERQYSNIFMAQAFRYISVLYPNSKPLMK